MSSTIACVPTWEKDLKAGTIEHLKKGFVNLEKHIENMKKFKIPAVVALNIFEGDTNDEIKLVKEFCKSLNIGCAEMRAFEQGAPGGVELAELVSHAVTEKSMMQPIYELEDSIEKKIEKPNCIAKTNRSLSDNPKAFGRPENFKITIRGINISAGAGFLVPLTGDVMLMPGLPKQPNAMKIDVDCAGRISGLS